MKFQHYKNNQSLILIAGVALEKVLLIVSYPSLL